MGRIRTVGHSGVDMDFRAVTLAGLMPVGCGLFCGAFPAFVGLRSKASEGFREAGRSNAGSRRESALGRGLRMRRGLGGLHDDYCGKPQNDA